MSLGFNSEGAPMNLGAGDGGLDPKVIWRLVRDKWHWIAAAALLGVSLGVGKYLISPKLYRATTQIQIEPRNLAPVGQDRNPWIEQWTNMKYFPTQYRLLRSRGLAERVIDELRLESDPRFAPSGNRDGSGPVTAEEDERYKAALANRLIGGLSVDPIAGTELLNLTYVATDPKLAADLANGFASAFIQWGIDSRSDTLRQANELLNTQIENLRHDVEGLERRIQDFGQTASNAADASAGSVSQRVQSLNDQYSTAAAAALTKRQRYNELVSMSDALVAESFGRSAIASVRADLEKLQTEYEAGLDTYKPDHPEMVELKGRVEAAQRRYQREVSAEAKVLRASAESEWRAAQLLMQRLDTERSEAQRQNLALNVEVLPLTNLQMELAAKRQRLGELIESQSQADLSADVQENVRSNVHIIDRALVPGGPFRPSLKQNVALGGGLGLMLGIGLVFLTHFLDRTLKSAEEIEQLLGIPVLAAIPDLGAGGSSYGYRKYYGYGNRTKRDKAKDEGPVDIELLPESKPRLAVSEAYRSLRTALLLSSAEELKLVTVTSAEAGEGKSATSSNLATVLAQLGKRVLVIDGDLRKARQHRIFKLPNSQGVVDCLARGTHPDTLVQKTEISGLFVLPAGVHPPNPSELLASERMKHLANWAREKFDFVIIDSPPILAVSDAILPGSISDGVMLCFRANQIERDTARRCAEQLRLSGVKILGVVLNRYRPGASRYYDRRYQTYEAYADTHADSAA